MLAMHFGHPDPEMRSHDATASGAAIRPASAATPHVAGRHGSHSDSTARGVGCCARQVFRQGRPGRRGVAVMDAFPAGLGIDELILSGWRYPIWIRAVFASLPA
jgi:hypothetical protein